MTAFLLETLAGRTWKRDGRLFWTRDDAEREAMRILRRGKAVEVRILPAEVSPQPVDTLASSGVATSIASASAPSNCLT